MFLWRDLLEIPKSSVFQFVCSVHNFIIQEAVAQRCSVQKVFSEISQNSQENPCVRDSFLIKLQA